MFIKIETSLSIGDRLQAYVIQLDQSPRYRVLGSIGARLIASPGMLIARILDAAFHALIGIAKLFIGLILLPVHFTARLLKKQELKTDWTIAEALNHIGQAILFGVDSLAAPFVNLINPDLNGRTWRLKEIESEITQIAPDIKRLTDTLHEKRNELKIARQENVSLKDENSRLKADNPLLAKKILDLNAHNLTIQKELDQTQEILKALFNQFEYYKKKESNQD